VLIFTLIIYLYIFVPDGSTLFHHDSMLGKLEFHQPLNALVSKTEENISKQTIEHSTGCSFTSFPFALPLGNSMWYTISDHFPSQVD